MLDNERIQGLKQNAESIIELIEKIEYLRENSDRTEDILRKEKQYYMDEYRKTSDALHDMIRRKEEQDKNKSTVIKCEDRNCMYNVYSVCQADEITVNTENTCLLSEQNSFPSLGDIRKEQARRKNCCEANNKKSKEGQK